MANDSVQYCMQLELYIGVLIYLSRPGFHFHVSPPPTSSASPPLFLTCKQEQLQQQKKNEKEYIILLYGPTTQDNIVGTLTYAERR